MKINNEQVILYLRIAIGFIKVYSKRLLAALIFPPLMLLFTIIAMPAGTLIILLIGSGDEFIDSNYWPWQLGFWGFFRSW